MSAVVEPPSALPQMRDASVGVSSVKNGFKRPSSDLAAPYSASSGPALLHQLFIQRLCRNAKRTPNSPLFPQFTMLKYSNNVHWTHEWLGFRLCICPCSFPTSLCPLDQPSQMSLDALVLKLHWVWILSISFSCSTLLLLDPVHHQPPLLVPMLMPLLIVPSPQVLFLTLSHLPSPALCTKQKARPHFPYHMEGGHSAHLCQFTQLSIPDYFPLKPFLSTSTSSLPHLCYCNWQKPGNLATHLSGICAHEHWELSVPLHALVFCLLFVPLPSLPSPKALL